MQDKIYQEYRKWRTAGLRDEEGIVIGSDITQEWLLPWWWEKYRRYNSYPVTFVDFGMSKEMKKWCQERGEFIRLYVADIFVANKDEIDPSLLPRTIGAHGKFVWTNRNAWFKKPLACLQSPYKKSIWIDSDCEIRGPLKKIFELCQDPYEVGIVLEQTDPDVKMIGYNSGVVAFKHGVPVMEEWAELALDRNHEFFGDQDILSKLLLERKHIVVELPLIYNWSRCIEEIPGVVVMHWHGQHGKSIITHQIMRANLESETTS